MISHPLLRPVAAALSLGGAAAACGPARPAPTSPPDETTSLALPCPAGEPVIDPEDVATAWLDVVDGRPPTPLRLPPLDEACRRALFPPVAPGELCLEGGSGFAWWPIPDVGTIGFHVASGAAFLTSPLDSLWDVDGYLVERMGSVQVNVRVPRGAWPGERRWVPGFPEHVIDDAHAIVRADPGYDLFHLPTRKVLLRVAPAGHPDANVAGTAFVPDARARHGTRLLGGVVFGGPAGAQAFAISDAGKPLGAAHGLVAKVIATDAGELVLAAGGTDHVEVVRVGPEGERQRVRVPLPPDGAAATYDVVLAASQQTVAMVFGRRAVIVAPGAAPRVLELPEVVRMQDAVRVPRGGKVVVLTTGLGVRVLDAVTGAPIVPEARARPIWADETTAAVADLDTPQTPVVLVSGDGTVRRGTTGAVTIGRFEVPTFAGTPHPGTACAARVLSAVPPMVRYREYGVIPAAALGTPPSALATDPPR